MFNFLKKKVYCGGEMLKKRSRELRKFIKTMFCAPGTEVTSLEPAHSLGNTQNGVLKSFFVVAFFAFIFFSPFRSVRELPPESLVFLCASPRCAMTQ